MWTKNLKARAQWKFRPRFDKDNRWIWSRGTTTRIRVTVAGYIGRPISEMFFWWTREYEADRPAGAGLDLDSAAGKTRSRFHRVNLYCSSKRISSSGFSNASSRRCQEIRTRFYDFEVKQPAPIIPRTEYMHEYTSLGQAAYQRKEGVLKERAEAQLH